MRKILEWAVERPTIVNLFSVALLAMGLAALSWLPKESFPATDLDKIQVKVVQRGAGPREIERGILLKIEESLRGIDGIEYIKSTAKENLALLTIEVARGKNSDKILREVKDAVDGINSFPKSAETPVITKLQRRVPVADFALRTKASRADLQSLADKIRDDLLDSKGISQVDIVGAKNREISIELKEENLRKYKLTVSDVVRALQQANMDLSGGTMKTKKEDLRLRFYGKKFLARDLHNVVVRHLPGGNVIRIKDVATARETFEEVATALNIQGQKAVLLRVQSPTDANVLNIIRFAKQRLPHLQKKLPAGFTLTLHQDYTVNLKSRISILVSNGAQGLLLVLLVLAFFMNLRLAFWVSTGLMLSMVGSFFFMSAANLTINMISLFGLILVIGILVDDAIVISENIYAHLEQGKSPVQAAVDGTMEVLPAVITAVTTTCLTFMPLFFIGGGIGKFIYMIPAVVIIALVVSLFEAFFILPPHLAHALKPRGNMEHRQNAFRTRVEGFFTWSRDKLYGSTLQSLLKYRYAVFAFTIAMMLFAVGLIRGGKVKFVFFPQLEQDRIVARFVMKPGTPEKTTIAVAKRLETKAAELKKELKAKYGHEVVVRSLHWIGLHTAGSGGFSGPSGSEVGEVQVELVDSKKRTLTSTQIINLWRKKTGTIPGATQLSFSTLGGPPLGRPMEFQLMSNNTNELKRATAYFKRQLARFPGVFNPSDDLRPGKRELRMTLTPLARSQGLKLQQIASQIRNRVYGQEVMKLQRGRDEVRVMVRYPDSSRSKVSQLHSLWITKPDGTSLPLTQLVTWKSTHELEVIRREQRKQLATIFAQFDETKGNRADIVAVLKKEVFPTLRKMAPSVKVVISGQGKEQAKAFSGMKYAVPASLFAIFFVLMLVFQSYRQTLLVMSMIPFGVIGAVFGHWLLGYPLTILSFFGIVGVSGVVVNDSIVLIESLNRQLEKGLPPAQAAYNAAISRFRPILSTTLTTIMGLMPLLFEKSLQAQFLIPMAISLAFGVFFATVLTLAFLPSLFLMTEDMAPFFRWLKTGEWTPSANQSSPEGDLLLQATDNATAQ